MSYKEEPDFAPHLDVLNKSEVKEVIREIDKRQAVVFYPGSFMTLEQQSLYGFHLGGKLFPERRTVPNNYVVRCQFTPLKEAMMSVHSALVDPKERKNYIQAYTATQIWNPVTMQFENVTVGKSKDNSHLLFKKLYPSQEIGQVVGDGVIEVLGLESVQDIRDAQLFFFPEWREYLKNLRSFPTTLRQLREQLAEKIAKTDSSELKQIGAQILRACDEFRRFGTKYIAHQSLAIKQAEKTDGVQVYDEIGESYFPMLELKRQDTLIQDFVRDQQEALKGTTNQADQMTLLTQLVTQLSTLVLQNQGFNAQGAPQGTPVQAQSSTPPKPVSEVEVFNPLTVAFETAAESEIGDEEQADEIMPEQTEEELIAEINERATTQRKSAKKKETAEVEE